MTPPDFDFSQYDSSPSNISLGGSSDAQTTTSFGDDVTAASVDSGRFSIAGPPYIPLFVGIGLAAAGIVLGLLAGSITMVAFVAWALSGPLAIGAFAFFSLRDTKQRAKPLYGERASAIWLHRGGIALAFIGVVISAIAIANWAGRA